MVSHSTRRRRDRHGRGLRGELLPPTVPAHRTRSQRFDDLVLDAVDRLEERFASELAAVEFAVDDVPPPPADEAETTDPPETEHRGVSLSELVTGPSPRIVIYRRPLQARAHSPADLADLVFDVIVHEVARLLGVTPEVIDPEGHLPDDPE